MLSYLAVLDANRREGLMCGTGYFGRTARAIQLDGKPLSGPSAIPAGDRHGVGGMATLAWPCGFPAGLRHAHASVGMALRPGRAAGAATQCVPTATTLRAVPGGNAGDRRGASYEMVWPAILAAPCRFEHSLCAIPIRFPKPSGAIPGPRCGARAGVTCPMNYTTYF
jgi:hypothetical protein